MRLMRRRRLYEDNYDGYFTDDREEDKAKILDVYSCFKELNELFGGYIEQIVDCNEFWFREEYSSLSVCMKLERAGRIDSGVITLESEIIGDPASGALLGSLLNTINDSIKKNKGKIDKILRYMEDNNLVFNPIFDSYWADEFRLKI